MQNNDDFKNSGSFKHGSIKSYLSRRVVSPAATFRQDLYLVRTLSAAAVIY